MVQRLRGQLPWLMRANTNARLNVTILKQDSRLTWIMLHGSVHGWTLPTQFHGTTFQDSFATLKIQRKKKCVKTNVGS